MNKKTAKKAGKKTTVKTTGKGKLEQSAYFGVPIYSIMVRGFKDHRQPLIDYILELRHQDKGVNRSNVRGWHSTENLHGHDNEHTRWMSNKIQNIALTAAKHFHGEKRPGSPRLAACWANVNDTGAWNAPHQHLPADWSGVFYLRAENKSAVSKNGIADGDLLFFNTLPMGRRFDRPTTIGYRPVDGKMLIFPAYATHMVAPHYEEESRISVSFNLFWQSDKN